MQIQGMQALGHHSVGSLMALVDALGSQRAEYLERSKARHQELSRMHGILMAQVWIALGAGAEEDLPLMLCEVEKCHNLMLLARAEIQLLEPEFEG